MKRPPLAVLLLVAVVLAGCTGEGGTDSDGDGLYDHEEERGWLVTVDLVGRRVEYRATSDPSLEDTDGDGLGDAFEFQTFPPLDPSKADTDGDGLTDCQEAFHSVREECESPTWTGMTDGGTGTDPANADSDAGFSRYVNNVLGFDDDAGSAPDPVPWGDGIPDGEEIAGYNVTLGDGRVRFVQTDPRNGDTDGDGLEDGEERFLYGSDPTVRNTDGDSCDDGRDPVPWRTERYEAGLQTVELFRSFDGGGARVAAQVNLLDVQYILPEGDTGVRVEQGEVADISALDPGPQEWETCSSSPLDPWTRVQLQLYHADGDDLRRIDMSSQTVPNGGDAVPVVWLHIPSGEYALSREEERFVGPVVWRGEDAEVVWTPRLL